MTEQQINNIYINCNRAGVDMEDLLKLCLSDSGVTIEGLRAAKYNKIDQLEELYNVELENMTWIKVSTRGTIDELSNFIKKINQGVFSNVHLQEAKAKLKEMAAELEDKEWLSIRVSNKRNEVMSFIIKIKEGTYSDNYLNEALRIVELLDWTHAKDSHDSLILSNYIRNCKVGFYPTPDMAEAKYLLAYPSSHIEEAKGLLEEWESGAIIADWNKILTETDMDARLAKVAEFVFRYNTNPSETARQYIEKASKEQDRIKDEKEARKDWIDATQEDTILGYVGFINKHPYSDYREDADQRIQTLKGDLLSDMKRYPFKYKRSDMYEYISTNALTWKDLVDDSHVLTDRAYSHIREYPDLKLEQRTLPVSKLANPNSEDGNTDVFFFGVPGSGKSCVLAGLMAQTGNLGFSFDPRGNGGGGNYAIELRNYARRSMLPPKTDDYYIQVIDAEINDEKNRLHKLSLIEMAGERTAAFAAIEDSDNLEDLGPGAAQLLSNDNNKIIFFVIDPTNEKNVSLDDNSDQWLMQSDVLNCITSLLSKNKSLMKKVVAIHVILTKSDTLGEYIDAATLQNVMTDQGYNAVLGDLKKICEKYDINKQTGFQVGIYPFCVGKFMPGDVYTFDDTDSLKILRVIQKNSIPRRKKGFMDSLSDWFNS